MIRILRTPLLLSTLLLLAASSALPDGAHAQERRAIRRAAAPRPGGVVIAAYYRPLFLSPFHDDPFYDPWWYPYPYGWHTPYAYGQRYATASMRLQVSPRDTEVFVDGYYAGIVDDYDGLFQRLRLEPGPVRDPPVSRGPPRRRPRRSPSAWHVSRSCSPGAVVRRSPVLPSDVHVCCRSARTRSGTGDARGTGTTVHVEAGPIVTA